MSTVKPRVRLSGKEFKVGDLVEVRTLVNHAMESGQRKDSAGNLVPRNIINTFTCAVNDKVVFAVTLEPAIAANPFIQFKFKATESGVLKMVWTDDDGVRIVHEEALLVT